MRVSVLLLPLLAAGCDQAIGAGDAPPPKVVKTDYVATSLGRIDSAGEARQLVASADGVIRHVYVERGDAVAEGQLLMRVDCAPRAASAAASAADASRLRAAAQTVLAGARGQQRDTAQQQVLAAKAARDDAADRFAQAQALQSDGFISRREISARENALTSAEAALRAAEADASLVEAGARPSEKREAVAAARAARYQAQSSSALAEQCNVRSPIAGTVLQILKREGEFSGASQGAPLLAVGDLSRLVVRVEISERDAAKVDLGQSVDVWIEGSKTRWKGRISSLASVMGRRSARSLDPTDRFDRDVREAFVEIEGDLPPALVGLRVIVGVKPA